MTTLVMINGARVPPDQAAVSVFDRGFLYGDSVFETLRTYGGKPFALERHIQRLEQSAARVFLAVTNEIALLREEISQATRESGNTESYIRAMLTRGVGESLGLDPAIATHPLRLVIVQELHPPAAELYEKGIHVVTFRTQRVADATEAAGAKVGNYLVAVLAMHEARKVGAAEALIVDAAGHVVEGATSNLFAVSSGALITPPESAGILAGITRAFVLELANELKLRIELRTLTIDELFKVDELFISSSIRELLPVVNVDEKPIGRGVPGRTTLELLQAFRKKVRE